MSFFTYSLPITIDNAIRVQWTADFRQQFPGLVKQVQADTQIANPEYLEAKRLGRRAFGIDRWIYCFEWDSAQHILTLPRGYLDRFGELLAQNHIHGIVTPNWTVASVDMPEPLVELRDYQMPAAQALIKSRQGILEAMPGAGKTFMAMFVVMRLGQRTIWLTHTIDLADQARKSAIKAGIPAEAIGMIGGGRDTEGTHLTIALIQSLYGRYLGQMSNEYGCLVLDECHHVPASMFRTVVHQFKAAYRYGLSGSLERADKLESISHLYLGPTLYSLGVGVMQETGGTITPKLVTLTTSVTVPAWESYLEAKKRYEEWLEQQKARFEAWMNSEIAAGHAVNISLEAWIKATVPYKKRLKNPIIDFTSIQTELLENPVRNAMLTQAIVEFYRGHSTLVITSRIAHCELLEQMIREAAPECRVASIHGKLGKTARTNILDAMRAGELDVLLSVNIAKEGLDIPRLDRLIIAAGGRSVTGIKQQVGRIQRLFAGKESATVIDIVDKEIGPLYYQYLARRRIYKELGMTVERLRRTSVA